MSRAALVSLLLLCPTLAFSQTYIAQPLVSPTGFSDCYAYSVNDNGVAIGSCFDSTNGIRAVIWRDGVVEVLPLPPGYVGSEGLDSRNGTSVGNCYLSTGFP